MRPIVESDTSSSLVILNRLDVLSVVSLKGCEAASSQPSLLVTQRNVTNGDKPFFKSPL